MRPAGRRGRARPGAEAEATSDPIHRPCDHTVAADDAGLSPSEPTAGTRVHILGPVEVQPGRGDLPAQPVPGRNARALLAALAARAGRPARREALIADLWGEKPAGTSENLRLAVMRLRSALAALDGERGRLLVVTVPDGYRLSLAEPTDLDAALFERLLDVAKALASSGSVAPARARLDEALALWRGDPLPELVSRDIGVAEAARLCALKEDAIDLAFDLALKAGDHAALPSQIEAALADHPYREPRWGHLIVALYRSGRQADALSAYQRARRRLAEDLGLDPGADLRRLEAAVLAQDPALGWELPTSRSPRVPSAGKEPSPVAADEVTPMSPPTWVQRQRELPLVGHEGPLARLWAGWRSVVEASGGGVALVDGDPGVGKSRLAAEVAERVMSDGGRVLATRCISGAGLAALVPSLEQLGIPVETMPLLPGSPALVDVAHRVAHELRFGSSHQPTLLVLDDAQWLDEQMVAMFADLGDRPWPVVGANPNLVLVLTQRGWPMPPGTPRMMSAIERLSWQDHVVLDVLDDDDARALVDEVHRVAGRASSLPASTVDEIVAASGGNARALVELTRAEGVPETGEAAAFGGALRQSFSERFDRQPPEVTDVVLTAAIVGQEVELTNLDRARDRDGSLAPVEAAVAARLLDEVPERPGHFRFLNRIDRELALERVSRARRTLIERRLERP